MVLVNFDGCQYILSEIMNGFLLIWYAGHANMHSNLE